MASLAEDDLHTNVLYCPYCGSYNFFDKGLYNTNVLFCLVGSKASNFDGLKEVLIEKLTDKGISVNRRKIQHIHIERFMLPIREFVSNKEHMYVSMLETNAEEIEENNDIRELLENNLQNIEKLFSMNKIHPLRLSLLQDVTDIKGQIYKTHILPVSRSKHSVDEVYKISPLEMLHILYIPIYRLSFDDKGKTYVCMGDENLTGLPINDLVKKTNDWMTNLNMISDNDDLLRLTMVISSIIACLITVVDIVYTIRLCNESDNNLFLSLIANVIPSLIISITTLITPIYVFLSSFVNTILAYVDLRKRMLRKLLVNRFGYKSQII